MFQSRSSDASPAAPRDGAVPQLTPRERVLLALLADGHSYLNAAGQLGISINTVRNHIRSIYTKLGVHSAPEAVARAIKQGLV